MYYNDYEDYMRSVLGYNNTNSNMPNMYNSDYYMPNRMQAVMPTYQNENQAMQMQDNIEDLYPDIYKIVNPIVCRVCQNNNKPITNDLIEQMITEVYNNIEANDINIVNINVETGNIENTEVNNRSIENRESKNVQDKRDSRPAEEKRQRRPNNPLLRDLIRILILNRLFGGNRPGNRPPLRPPFPGTGMQGMPPMRPRHTGYTGNNIEAEPQMGMYGFDNYYRY